MYYPGGDTGGGDSGGDTGGGDTGGGNTGGGSSDDSEEFTGELPGKFSTGAETFGEAASNFQHRISESPLVQSGDQLVDVFRMDNGSCPSLSVTLPRPINATISTDIHCQIMNDIKGIISSVMLVIFTIIGFRIIMGA